MELERTKPSPSSERRALSERWASLRTEVPAAGVDATGAADAPLGDGLAPLSIASAPPAPAAAPGGPPPRGLQPPLPAVAGASSAARSHARHFAQARDLAVNTGDGQGMPPRPAQARWALPAPARGPGLVPAALLGPPPSGATIDAALDRLEREAASLGLDGLDALAELGTAMDNMRAGDRSAGANVPLTAARGPREPSEDDDALAGSGPQQGDVTSRMRAASLRLRAEAWDSLGPWDVASADARSRASDDDSDASSESDMPPIEPTHVEVPVEGSEYGLRPPRLGFEEVALQVATASLRRAFDEDEERRAALLAEQLPATHGPTIAALRGATARARALLPEQAAADGMLSRADFETADAALMFLLPAMALATRLPEIAAAAAAGRADTGLALFAGPENAADCAALLAETAAARAAAPGGAAAVGDLLLAQLATGSATEDPALRRAAGLLVAIAGRPTGRDGRRTLVAALQLVLASPP